MKVLILIIFIYFIFSIIYSTDYTIIPHTYSVQSGDFDNDGDNDIVVEHINPGRLSFIQNNGYGEFVLLDTLSIAGMAKCYFLKNLDDNPAEDVAFYSRNDTVGFMTIIYNGDYLFPHFYNLNNDINMPIVAASCGDFDADGDYDIVFSSSGSGLDNLWGLIYNLGNQEFSEPEWFECPDQAHTADFENFECHDLDNNGFDDIIAYSVKNTYIYYFSTDGFNLDSLNYGVFSSGMTSSDFDNDGDYDIVIVHWANATEDNFKIYENIGNQDFILHNYYCPTLWSEPISCKLNSDDLVDIVTVGNEIKKYFNEGILQFSEVSIQDYPDYGESFVEQSFSDFDGNGTEDIAIIRYGIEENNLTILFNDGEGNFLEEPQTGINSEELIINNFILTNYPNPFNPTTTINYQIKKSGKVELNIYNIKGQKVKTLVNKQEAIGLYQIMWNGKDNANNSVSSGVYFYKLSINGKSEPSRKCLLLK